MSRVPVSTRFKVQEAQELIANVLHDRLGDQKYSSEDASRWTKEISDEIKSRLKGNLSLNFLLF